MTRKTLLAAAAVVSALFSGQALADVTYYGTSTMLPASQEQNNADIDRTQAIRTSEKRSSSFTSRQAFGNPNTPTAARAPRKADFRTYYGTSGRAQDNADANMR